MDLYLVLLAKRGVRVTTATSSSKAKTTSTLTSHEQGTRECSYPPQFGVGALPGPAAWPLRVYDYFAAPRM
jgi:hypothetical protein